MTTRLTIVIPTLNEAARIVAQLQALRSLRAQGVEVIVADGGSTDRTAALARRGPTRCSSARAGAPGR